MPRLSLAVERFPIAGTFVIARGAKTEAAALVATIEDGANRGRGECVPYGRYGESLESVAAAIESIRPQIEAGADRYALQDLLPAGAARNALDCALWDFDAKRLGVPAYRLAPEFAFPSGLRDGIDSYRYLLQKGVAASSIIIAGDDAGGGLAFALLLAIRNAGLPMPAGCVAISP